MAEFRTEDAAASFDPLRPKLIRIAYRMLGSVADAEDAVQDAFIRWMSANRAEVGSQKPSCAGRSRAFALISLNRPAGSARHILGLGYPILSSKTRKKPMSPYP
jgi:hypothetical protein